MNAQLNTADLATEFAAGPDPAPETWEVAFSIRLTECIAQYCRSQQYSAHEMFIIGVQTRLPSITDTQVDTVNRIASQVQRWLENDEEFQRAKNGLAEKATIVS